MPRSTFPAIQPMTLGRVREPFDHPEWVFEVKYDGFRALAYLDGGDVSLVSRHGNTYKSFPTAQHCLSVALPGIRAVLDGELACLDSQGCADFNALLYRRSSPAFCAFDLLWLNGTEL